MDKLDLYTGSPSKNESWREYAAHSLDHDDSEVRDPTDRCWCELSGCPQCGGPGCRCHRVTYVVDDELLATISRDRSQKA